MDSVEGARNFGHRDTQVVGILRTMNDVRRSDSKAFKEMIEEDYPNEIFKPPLREKRQSGD